VAEVRRGPAQSAAPSTYELAGVEAFTPEAVTATFDGTLAASAFLPTLSVYAQSGELLSRSPASEVAVGSSAEVTFAPLLRAALVAAAAGGGYPFCQAGIGGFYNVPSGVNTTIGIDPGTLIDSGGGIFTEDTTGGGVTGVSITAVGTYGAFWGVEYVDTAGTPLANPQNFVVNAQDFSGSLIVGLPYIGSVYGRGFTNFGGRSDFQFGWLALFTMHAAAPANDPIVLAAIQNTGVQLRAYTQVAMFQLLPTAIF
jgi:hypothetical protein